MVKNLDLTDAISQVAKIPHVRCRTHMKCAPDRSHSSSSSWLEGAIVTVDNNSHFACLLEGQGYKVATTQ